MRPMHASPMAAPWQRNKVHSQLMRIVPILWPCSGVATVSRPSSRQIVHRLMTSLTPFARSTSFCHRQCVYGAGSDTFKSCLRGARAGQISTKFLRLAAYRIGFHGAELMGVSSRALGQHCSTVIVRFQQGEEIARSSNRSLTRSDGEPKSCIGFQALVVAPSY